MADRAENLDIGGRAEELGPVDLLRQRQAASDAPTPLAKSSGEPSGPKLLVRSSTERGGTAFRGARARAVSMYSTVTDTSAKIAGDVRRRVSQQKDEHPLQFLAVIAGSAFVIGVFLRVWRSRTHE
jgi:hypothetical protein